MHQLTFLAPRRLEWRAVPDPELSSPAAALVRPLLAATCDLDRRIIAGMDAFPAPFPLGHECVAEVVEVGSAVRSFRPSDRVVVPFQISCGSCDRCLSGRTANCRAVPGSSMYGMGARGGPWGGMFADLVNVPFADAMLVPLPPNIEPELAASASDQLPDAWRTVAPPLASNPRAEVLVLAGERSALSLYAAGIARALGASRVTFASDDPESLAAAELLGAEPVEVSSQKLPRRLGRFPIVVSATATAEGLSCALRSVEPGGVCVSPTIFWSGDVPVPLFDMYNTGVTFVTGKVHARPTVPAVLDLLASDRFDPRPVTTAIAAPDEASEALTGRYIKLLLRLA